MICSTKVQIVNSENGAVYMSKYITLTRKEFIRKNSRKEVDVLVKVNPVETYLKEDINYWSMNGIASVS